MISKLLAHTVQFSQRLSQFIFPLTENGCFTLLSPKLVIIRHLKKKIIAPGLLESTLSEILDDDSSRKIQKKILIHVIKGNSYYTCRLFS